ncbi:large subunit GTPase 1 homolog [Microplitis demolitor]|uniref:large subunit GTPase 1 homolog n=1 Tax=Microplitis demolitor TaxID=69319 RepID=UPI00043FFE9C|nr:large subunit GTPase 1 homolog [Microplitis demolitor]
MGKKNKGSDLGKALIRDRFGSKKRGAGSMLHSADVEDGYRWDRLNLRSITQENTFEEFLRTAQLAGTEFQAEKLDIKYVNPQSGMGLPTEKERADLLELYKTNANLLKIPRRPKWDDHTSAQELHARENTEFLEWRRQLSLLQEAGEMTITPYEKNLEFWRQLWRVVERSDVVVQIVDARNPLLFRCEDLEKYVKEIDADKKNMILVNKADFLTVEQRQAWCDYFTEVGIKVAFFSALDAAELNDKNKTFVIDEEDEDEKGKNDDGDEDETDEEDDDDVSNNTNDSESEISSYVTDFGSDSEYQSADDNETIELDKNPTDENEDKEIKNTDEVESIKTLEMNSPELLTREQLISFFKSLKGEKTYTPNVVTIGLVGYPNVGKSSTINAIMADKKVSVSATPGKTKHFQTLFVDSELLLCDCPGLVMPSFICTKAEMVLHGILPIDQLRDHVPSVTLLGTWIPRHILEDTYGIMLPPPRDGEDLTRPPTSEEILNTYGYSRGFMTANGQPDNPRSARYLLKDFVNGKLLYCVAPPNKKQEEYHTFPPRRRIYSANHVIPPQALRASRGVTVTNEDIDRAFFKNQGYGVHVKGLPGKVNPANSQTLDSKPWKKMNKHVNKKKKEKTRRLYSHLDIH